MDLDPAVVLNETQFSKFVHEKTHAGSRRSNHLRKSLLADFRNHRLRFSFLAKVRQQQEQPGKTLFTRVEQLIDQVRFDADRPTQKMGNEHLGECRLLMNHAQNLRFLQSRNGGIRYGRNGRHAQRLTGKASFTEKLVRSKNCDDRLLALLRDDGDLHLATLDVEDLVRGFSLRENDLVLAESTDVMALGNLGEKGFRIE
jgi:hypothetical protein